MQILAYFFRSLAACSTLLKSLKPLLGDDKGLTRPLSNVAASSGPVAKAVVGPDH